MALAELEHERIAAAVRAAEAGTSGEIVCVVARASGSYALYSLVWAAALALFAPTPLLLLTQWSAERIYLLQLALFIAFALALAWPPLRMSLVPRRVRRARAWQAAVEQFRVRGIARTKARSGILIYVSLAERYARIVPDEAIAAKVEQQVWKKAVADLTGLAREGRLSDGLIRAVETCGEVLREHGPPQADGDELPDNVFLI